MEAVVDYVVDSDELFTSQWVLDYSRFIMRMIYVHPYIIRFTYIIILNTPFDSNGYAVQKGREF